MDALTRRAALSMTGADLKTWSPQDLQHRFGKAGGWFYEIARGQDDRPVNPNRERKSSGSETTFEEDLTDQARIEAGVLAMADDVWAWCEKTGGRGRTVTVKIKWADFQQATRSQSLGRPVDGRAMLHEASLGLIRSVFPPPKSIRLVGVTLSNFAGERPGAGDLIDAMGAAAPGGLL
jgi:DNA polymerase-4